MAILAAGESILSPVHQPSQHRDIIVIGGSAGGLAPLGDMLAKLPPDLRATVLVTLHRSRSDPYMSELLWRHSKLRVAEATDEAPLRLGHVLLAPADRHLLLENGRARVVRGPRENSARPSIDVLFRSAAVEFGSRVVAVLLSGTMSDGVAGLIAVKQCGGCTIVQHPDDAAFRELPEKAVRIGVDHSIEAARLPEVVLSLVSSEAQAPVEIPEGLRIEARHAALHMANTHEVAKLGPATQVSCPECGGPMRHVDGKGADSRYRCEVGHAYGTDAMLEEQARSLERALWIAYRTLKERSALVNDMAEHAQSSGQTYSAEHYRSVVKDLEEHADSIKSVLEAGRALES